MTCYEELLAREQKFTPKCLTMTKKMSHSGLISIFNFKQCLFVLLDYKYALARAPLLCRSGYKVVVLIIN